jgi:hypothetical protein
LTANQQEIVASFGAFNRPCVAHQKHVGGRTSAHFGLLWALAGFPPEQI